MDWLTFFAEILKALGWPAAAVTVVLLLRTEIKTLLSLVKKLKAGPVEAEFDREVRELKSSAESQLPLVAVGASASPQRQKLLQLAEINPRSAIIEAWQSIEFSARRLLEHLEPNLTVRELQSPVLLLRALNRREVLTRDEVAIYNDLRALRNQAVHAGDFAPSYESALNYIDLSVRLQSAIEARLPGGTAS